MPISRHGYVSDETKSKLNSVYASAAWKEARRVVLARDGYRCRFCGEPAKPGRSLAVAHLGWTSSMVEMGEDVYDVAKLVAAHQACHNAYAAGKVQLR